MTAELHTVARGRAIAAGAGAWVERLPQLIASLEAAWGMRVGDALSGGTEALVAPVTLGDGSEAVLKLMAPGGDTAIEHEVTALVLADGDGCARLLRHDIDRGALLMERLGPSLASLRLPKRRRRAIMCSAAARLWRPAAGHGLPTAADKGRWLVDFITTTWDELDRPCSERAVDEALACAEARIAAHDDERAVLVHGDIHEANTLQAGDGFKLVDPDGLLAEAEYDLGVIIREDRVDLLQGGPRERARSVARRTGRDAGAVWDWSVVERLSTGLMCTRIGLDSPGRQLLRIADRVAGLGGRA